MKHIFQIIIISTGLLLGQTAEQIKQAKEVIQRTGMSESQAKDAAKAQGYTDKQIDTAIQKEKATKTELGKSVPESSEKIGLPELGKSNEVVQKQPVLETIVPIVGEELPIIGNDDLEIVGDGDLEVVDETELDIESEGQPARGALTYFGYDIFARDPALFQATSVGAVDPNYLIGPGDEIIVMLWGETQFRQVLTVDREGFVFIPEIGQVFVNGLNLNLLESKLFRVFSQSYASLNPQGRTPTTFLDVSLGNLRPLRIQVLGEVAQPGAYTVSPSASLFSALYYFNGPTTRGSLRDIQLIRGGKKIASIDFYDYLLTGKKPKDQKLQLDDVIFIPRRLKTVTIEGEINRSGIYELKPKESLTDLITMAGDLKITAYLDRAQIDRIVPFEDRAELGMDRMYTDVNLEQVLKSADVFPLQDGDRMQIFSVLDLRQNVVDLRGAVTRPGSYDLGDSLKLSELINKGDGLLGDAYLERIDVVRIKPDFTEELIKLDLGQVLDGNPDYDIYLRGLDRVRVYGMTEMVPRTYVSITGHAKRPGRFLLQENMTLYDLIFKAGGYVDEEYKKLTYLKRAELVRVSKESDEKEIIPFNLGLVLDKQGIANTALRTDDAIRIYSVNEIEGDTRYVSISGHVKRPGQYELFAGNMTLYDLIFKAGGFDDPLYKSQTFLSRADLIRFDNDRITQSIIPFNLDAVLSDKNNEQNIILLPGDEIRVYSEIVFNTVESVSINGIVRSPGTYNLKTGMTLKDLILEAGGLNANVYRYRVEVARIDPLNNNLDEYAEVITFNMDEKFSVSSASSNDGSKKEFSATSNGFQLNPYDLVSIRPDPYFSNQKQVTISGEVLYPGQYIILTSDEKITDIIERAGGLRPNAYPDASQYTRKGVKINASLSDIIKNPKSKLNFKVQNGDEILILPHPNVVRIRGEVNTVGIHKYVSGKRLRYYLSLAGGLNPDADKRNIWVEYPNGDSKKFNYWSLLSPKIIDGSSIVVGKQKEEEPFDRTEFAKEVTAILANLAQAIAVVALASK
ncbi:MAG: hypothetical protein HN515_01895 [Candidatus Marinimicrobia bacterium]|nr:hypothetical protein [Candidatus Neomarinimicrobiota bacterium]